MAGAPFALAISPGDAVKAVKANSKLMPKKKFIMSLLLIIGGIVSVLLMYWQYWRWSHRRMLQLAALLPGPPALPIIGNTLLFIKPGVLLDIIGSLYEEYNQCFRFWLGPDLNILVKNPNDIRMLLTSNKVNQKGPLYKLMLPYIGPGILTGGPTWRNHRKIATPSYNKKSVEHYTPIFNIEAEQLSQELLRKDPGVTFDVYKDVVKYTTQCVNQTLMGLSKNDSENIYRMDEVVAKTRSMYDLIFDKMTKWWLQIPLIYWLLGGKTKEAAHIKLLDEFTIDLMARRQMALENSCGDEESMGIVDRFILSGKMSLQEIKWDIFSLYTTSQEASAKIASGVLLFLAHLPQWQEMVYEEIVQVLGKSGPVNSEQLKQLQYLDMVYKETLRYLSIAAFIQRTVEEEISINDGKIILPVGTSLLIPIHHLHRDPQYWENPNKVMPERFLPEKVKSRDPNAFIPFSLGPMDCLGRAYATPLIKTFIVWILRHVRLEADGALEDLKLHVAISVSFTDGYNVRVRPRYS